MQKNAPLILTLIVGAFLSIGASVVVREWETERVRDQFSHVAGQHNVIFHQRLSSTLEAVESIGALYAASEEVSRDEFRRFSELELENHPSIQALEWIPRVKAANRAAFEAAAREDGIKGFTFSERQSQGRMVPAADRDEYFPVYFVEPHRGNKAALGFDLGSNPARLAALERARDTGKLIVTERITLVQETTKSFGFLVFQPVYRNNTKTDTVEERRRNLQGFALGVLRINDLAETTGSPAEDLKQHARMNNFIFDLSAPVDRQLLYPATSPLKTLAKLASADCMMFPQTVGGREWVDVHCPKNLGQIHIEHWQSVFVLILGLLVTGGSAAYTRALSNQKLHATNISADLEQLIDTANAPIFGIDVEGKINEWNQTAMRITGFTKDDVMGHDLVAEFITDDYKAPVKEVFDKALRGEETSNYEFPLYSKAGKRIDVLLNSTTRRDTAGNIVGVIGIGQDITERKKTEKALVDSEARYSDIVDNARVLIQSFDVGNERFVFTNKAWQTTLGYGPDEIPALRMLDVVHPDSLEHCENVLREVLAGKAVGDIQATFVSKDGRNIEVEGNLVCRRSFDGARITHGVFTDVTARRQAEAQVIQAAKLATLGEMATSVAHELNQPLNVIRMAAGNIMRKLEKDSVDPAYLNEKLERIASQTERAAAIIDHMRMFGRKADEKQVLFDPRMAMQNALNLMGEQLRLVEIDVSLNLPETCPQVLGHKIPMEQVILNLLINARDAIQAAAPDGEKKIAMTLEDTGTDTVRVMVEDTGGGIPEKIIDRIFEPFYTTKKMGEGTGLGLSVSYGIIRDMGGTIEAENTNVGARFTITLPIVAQKLEKNKETAKI